MAVPQQKPFHMIAKAITSGTIFVSWWSDGAQNLRFISYGPNDAVLADQTIKTAMAEAAIEPACSVQLWLGCALIESLRNQNQASAGRYAAALAAYQGWPYLMLQETHDGHCYITQVHAQGRAEF